MKRKTTYLVMPTDLNPFGHLFGGTMMGWMDKIGVLLAMEYTGRNCVTVFADQIRFIRPVSIKEVVDLEAEVIDEGMTSLLIQVQACKRKTIEKSENSELVAESIFKFVALNKEGTPTDKWEHRLGVTRLLKGELKLKSTEIV